MIKNHFELNWKEVIDFTNYVSIKYLISLLQAKSMAGACAENQSRSPSAMAPINMYISK